MRATASREAPSLRTRLRRGKLAGQDSFRLRWRYGVTSETLNSESVCERVVKAGRKFHVVNRDVAANFAVTLDRRSCKAKREVKSKKGEL